MLKISDIHMFNINSLFVRWVKSKKKKKEKERMNPWILLLAIHMWFESWILNLGQVGTITQHTKRREKTGKQETEMWHIKHERSWPISCVHHLHFITCDGFTDTTYCTTVASNEMVIDTNGSQTRESNKPNERQEGGTNFNISKRFKKLEEAWRS